MLLKTIAEITPYIKIDATIQYDSLKPYVRDAEDKYIKEFIGDALYETLNDYHNATSPPTDAALDSLLPYVQNALAKFTLFMASPFLDLNISEGGFSVMNTQNYAPASEHRVNKLMKATKYQGFDNIETMLVFLEDNKADYSDWTGSTAYTNHTKNLVNTAEEFNTYVDIHKSRLLFRKIRQIIDHVDEIRIKAAISEDLFDEIITQVKAGSVSTANQAILTNLKKAEAFFGFHDYLKRNLDDEMIQIAGITINDTTLKEIEKSAEHYIARVNDTLYDNIDDYPLFEASDLYDSDREDNALYENDKDNKTFIFGPN